MFYNKKKFPFNKNIDLNNHLDIYKDKIKIKLCLLQNMIIIKKNRRFFLKVFAK